MTSLHALAAPVVLAAIAILHWAYFRRFSASNAQQPITLADLGFRSLRGAARFVGLSSARRAGVFDVFDGPERRGADPSLFDQAPPRLNEGAGHRVMLSGDTSIGPGRSTDTLICSGDLVVEGDCAFLGPVKVAGDLIVNGNAAFLKPLVVSGHTRIAGVAAVFSGMVAKGEAIVDGTLLVGGRGREGWMAARAFGGAGKVLLNGHIDTIEPDVDDAAPAAPAPRYPHVFVAIAIAALGYLLSIPLGAWVMAQFAHVDCVPHLTTLSCDYPRHAFIPGAWLGVGALAGAAWLASRVWLRRHLAYPFVALMCGLTLVASAYDGLAARPILREARIVSDTMNVLAFVMLASFILMLMILRRGPAPLWRVGVAVLTSFAAKTLAMLAFAWMRGSVAGATELLLLFAVYAFGGFAIHLMAIVGMLETSRPVALGASRRRLSAESGNRGAAVDGLRGLAILMVVIYHYVPPHFFSFNLGKPINSILFVVAGFFFAALMTKHAAVLDGPVRERLRMLGTLLVRRHIRVWPPLAIIVGLYLLLSVFDHGELTQQIRTTWPWFLTYSGYVPRWTYEANAFPAHLWVISAQETLLALLCAAFAIFGLQRVRKILWMLVAAGIAARLTGTILFMPAHPALALETPFAVLDPLALGMLARFGLEGSTMRSKLRRQTMLALMSAIALWIFLPNWNMSYFTFAPLIAALATALVMILSADDVRGRGIAAAGLGSPWLVFLGRISLSLFLLHPFVNTVLRLSYTQVWGVEMPWWLLFGVGPLLSIAAASLFSRIIEAPLRGISARALMPRSGRPARPASAALVPALS